MLVLSTFHEWIFFQNLIAMSILMDVAVIKVFLGAMIWMLHKFNFSVYYKDRIAHDELWLFSLSTHHLLVRDQRSWLHNPCSWQTLWHSLFPVPFQLQISLTSNHFHFRVVFDRGMQSLFKSVVVAPGKHFSKTFSIPNRSHFRQRITEDYGRSFLLPRVALFDVSTLLVVGNFSLVCLRDLLWLLHFVRCFILDISGTRMIVFVHFTWFLGLFSISYRLSSFGPLSYPPFFVRMIPFVSLLKMHFITLVDILSILHF